MTADIKYMRYVWPFASFRNNCM